MTTQKLTVKVESKLKDKLIWLEDKDLSFTATLASKGHLNRALFSELHDMVKGYMEEERDNLDKYILLVEKTAGTVQKEFEKTLPSLSAKDLKEAMKEHERVCKSLVNSVDKKVLHSQQIINKGVRATCIQFTKHHNADVDAMAWATAKTVVKVSGSPLVIGAAIGATAIAAAALSPVIAAAGGAVAITLAAYGMLTGFIKTLKAAYMSEEKARNNLDAAMKELHKVTDESERAMWKEKGKFKSLYDAIKSRFSEAPIKKATSALKAHRLEIRKLKDSAGKVFLELAKCKKQHEALTKKVQKLPQAKQHEFQGELDHVEKMVEEARAKIKAFKSDVAECEAYDAECIKYLKSLSGNKAAEKTSPLRHLTGIPSFLATVVTLVLNGGKVLKGVKAGL